MSGPNLSGPREPVELFLDNLESETSALEGVLQSKEVAVPQRGQKELIKSLLIVCGWIRHALQAERSARTEASPDSLMSLGRRYQLLIGDVQTKFLPYLVETDEAYCPSEIGMAVERLVARVEANSAVLLHPSESRIPEVKAVRDLQARFLAELGTYAPLGATPADEEPRLFVFLSYPQVMSRSPLIHAIILSHEVDHLLDWNTGLSAGLSTEMQLDPKDFDALVQDLKDRPILVEWGGLLPLTFGEPFTPEQLHALVLQRWTKVRDNWLAEIVSDLLAVRSFGPAYFFALGVWSLSVGVMYAHSDSHPCSRLRLGLMAQELQSMGLTHYSAGALGTARAHFDQWNKLPEDPRPTEGELIHEVAKGYVLRAFPRIRQAVRAASMGRGALTADSRNDVEYAVNLLRHGVPPAEIPEPSDRRLRACELATIFNAYFIFRSAHLDDLYELLDAKDDKERREALVKLDKLVLKAVEGSEVKRVWDEAAVAPPGEGTLHAD